MATAAFSTPPGGIEDMIVVLAQVGVRTRKQIEAHVEMLISFLDVQDGDENLEDDGNEEPILGWPAHGPQALSKVMDNDDREVEDENDEDGGDTEMNGDELDTTFCDDDYSTRIF